MAPVVDLSEPPVEDPVSPADPTVRASLADQEAFLVRSLADLEREHDAGDLTDVHHGELRADYTERLAAVRDAIVGGRDRPAPARPAGIGPARRPAVVAASAVAVVAFAVVAGLLVAGAVGRRDPGQSATGFDPRSARNQAAAALGGCFALEDERDADGAAICYQDYVTEFPDDSEGLAYFGWFLFRVGREGGSVELLDTAAVYLDRAVEVDPAYADARALRAITRAATGQRQGALADLEVLDTLDPPPGLVELVAPVRESLVNGTAPTTTTTGDDDVPADGDGPTTTAG